MTNPKYTPYIQALADKTEQFETKVKEFSAAYYASLEPWQRGLLLIALTTFLLFSIYYLTKKETPKPRELTEAEKKRIEQLAEERILKRAEFLRRLQQ